MRAFVQRHPVATYYVLVFAISWGGGVIVLGPGGILGSRPISAAQMPFVYLTAIAGPGVAGIVSTAVVHGRAGVRDLLSRLLRWRVSVRWYAIALLTAPLLVTAILFALSLTSPAFLPGIITTSDKTRLLVSGIAAALLVPPFEELGWTGFAIPQLRTRYGIVTTGVIVGLLWGAWHFPLFAESARSSATVPPSLYLAVLLFSWLPPYRVLMVWVYDRTKSLLVAMLMHVPIVVTSLVLGPATTPKVILTYDLIFASALWILVAAVAIGGGLKPRPEALGPTLRPRRSAAR
jgi:membrane protease YdiL (CAAX protease family)